MQGPFQMHRPVLLLIDLTHYGPAYKLLRLLDRHCELHVSTGGNDISGLIESVSPRALCFVYDHMEINSLNLLKQTKKTHPSIPILMVTEQHSEALAVWALRARAWDYFVIPVEENDLTNSLSQIAALRSDQLDRREPRTVIRPHQHVPPEARFRGTQASDGDDHKLLPAVNYVEKNLHEKIQQTIVAEICGLSSCQLSRKFKQLYGITFQEFILRRRVNEALRLLINPNAAVTDVAYTVGFNDSAHFTRTFRRYIGKSPSEYKRDPSIDTENFELSPASGEL
jgi:AraC-like DNA-binding protein/ActR/RegA family two-component response regulator